MKRARVEMRRSCRRSGDKKKADEDGQPADLWRLRRVSGFRDRRRCGCCCLGSDGVE